VLPRTEATKPKAAGDRLFTWLEPRVKAMAEADRPLLAQDELTRAVELSFGDKKISIEPLSMLPWTGSGQPFVGLRMEIRLNGKLMDHLSSKSLEFAETVEAAAEKVFEQWWISQGLPAMQYLAGKPPTLTIAGCKIYTAPFTKSANGKDAWMDGSPAMHTKILSILKDDLTKLPEGKVSAAMVAWEQKPLKALARNWDGKWIVDEKKKVGPAKPVAEPLCALNAEARPAAIKELAALIKSTKTTTEFNIGYLILRTN
jgi:hypothetical protein